MKKFIPYCEHIVEDVIDNLIDQANEEELFGLQSNLEDIDLEDRDLLVKMLQKTIIEWIDKVKI